MSEHWEVIIVGGGVAGLSAALTLGRARRQVLVVDVGEPRNRFAAHMHGMLGSDGVDPSELLRRGREEVSAYDVTIRPGAVETVAEVDDGLAVTFADGSTATTRALIAASGLVDELPEIPGLTQQWGAGVLHCPYCHGWEVRGQRLAVLGTSAISLHQAELIRQWSDQVTFFTADCGAISPDVAARLRSRGVRLIDSPVAEVLTEGERLTGARLADGSSIALDAVFIAPSSRPQDEYLAPFDLDRAENPMGSFVAVDPAGLTSHERVWAVGNIVNPAANVAVSIGAGSTAGGMVNMALVSEDFDRASSGHADEHAGDANNAEVQKTDVQKADVQKADGQGTASPANDSLEEYWEALYAESAQRWSGRANATTAEVVAALGADHGTAALELGCGEGGDAVWLATQGWHVTAVDVSTTAIERGADSARESGVAEAITWISHDLSTWTTEETFDLVTASFFHSTPEMPRTEILRRAAKRLQPGGHLLIVSHVFDDPEDIPPWVLRYYETDDPRDPALQDELSHLLTPTAELAALALDEAEWEIVIEEVRPRETAGPDGKETAVVKDGVLLLRRRAV